MGWVDAPPKRYLLMGEAASVAIRWRTNAMAAFFLLGGGIIQKLGWKTGDSIALAWGAGADKGKVRLTIGTPGFRLRPIGATRHALGFSTSVLPPGTPLEKHRRERCSVDYIEGGVIVTLPQWFKAAESQRLKLVTPKELRTA